MTGAGRVRAQEGQALVEAALTLLVLLIFIFGIVEGGRMLEVQQTLTDGARLGARYSVLPLTQTLPGTLPSVGAVQTKVQTFCTAAGVKVATGDITVNQAVTISGTTYSRVIVTYPYQVVTMRGFFGMLNMTLTGNALMRNETSP